MKFPKSHEQQCLEQTPVEWMQFAYDVCQLVRGHKGKHRSIWYSWNKNTKKKMPYLIMKGDKK
jgi:hypothetical protein